MNNNDVCGPILTVQSKRSLFSKLISSETKACSKEKFYFTFSKEISSVSVRRCPLKEGVLKLSHKIARTNSIATFIYNNANNVDFFIANFLRIYYITRTFHLFASLISNWNVNWSYVPNNTTNVLRYIFKYFYTLFFSFTFLIYNL